MFDGKHDGLKISGGVEGGRSPPRGGGGWGGGSAPPHLQTLNVYRSSAHGILARIATELPSAFIC